MNMNTSMSSRNQGIMNICHNQFHKGSPSPSPTSTMRPTPNGTAIIDALPDQATPRATGVQAWFTAIASSRDEGCNSSDTRDVTDRGGAKSDHATGAKHVPAVAFAVGAKRSPDVGRVGTGCGGGLA